MWSNSSKAFEAVYVAWWYVGPAHHAPVMDFMGVTAGSSHPAFYVVAAGVLFVIALLGRRTRLAYAQTYCRGVACNDSAACVVKPKKGNNAGALGFKDFLLQSYTQNLHGSAVVFEAAGNSLAAES